MNTIQVRDGRKWEQEPLINPFPLDGRAGGGCHALGILDEQVALKEASYV